jgi:hypothetical protein
MKKAANFIIDLEMNRKYKSSETWTLSKANEQRLSLFGIKAYRCIFGAKQENGIVCIK